MVQFCSATPGRSPPPRRSIITPPFTPYGVIGVPGSRYSASSTAARWPGTTLSSTTGVPPRSCCLVRSGLATPERQMEVHEGLDGQLLVQYQGRTIPTQEVPPRPWSSPCLQCVLSDMAPALTVGSTGWATTPRRAWHPSASSRPTAPHGTATAEFASLRHRHVRKPTPRQRRLVEGRAAAQASEASPFGQSPGTWASTGTRSASTPKPRARP